MNNKDFNKEMSKGFLDNVLYGAEVYKKNPNKGTIKHIPYRSLFSTENEVWYRKLYVYIKRNLLILINNLWQR